MYIENLSRIGRYSKQPGAAIYANQIFRSIEAYCDLFSFDKMTDFLLAVYDAMKEDEQWLRYSKKQYQKWHNLLESLLKRFSTEYW